jgi:hypothetical protein
VHIKTRDVLGRDKVALKNKNDLEFGKTQDMSNDLGSVWLLS